MKMFLILMSGQFLSQFGSALTRFCLGVWVFQQNDSATEFSLIFFFGLAPSVFLSPIAGAFADRYNRRMILLGGDTLAALSTLCVLFLFKADALQVWHIYAATLINAVASAFQWPAFTASISMMVPKKDFGRASGIGQVSGALTQIGSPVVAGFALSRIGLDGIIMIDIVSFSFAFLVLLLIGIPQPKRTESSSEKNSLWSDVTFGWRWILKRPALFQLLLIFAFTNLCLGMVTALSTPLILSLADSETLGKMMTVVGLGLLGGSVVMGVWGGPKDQVFGLFGFGLLGGVFGIFAGLTTSIPIIAASAAIFFFTGPLSQGCSQAIWQRKVEPGIQGRVFSFRALIATSTMPISVLIAGPLADHVFEPMMQPNGQLADSIGDLLGVGAGRGIGLMFVIIGIFNIAINLYGLLSPRMRKLDAELPDFDHPPVNPTDDSSKNVESLAPI